MLNRLLRLTCAPSLKGGLAQSLRMGVVVALLASVLALTSVNAPDAHAQDPEMTATATVNITVPQVDDADGDNIFSGRTFTLGLVDTTDPPQSGCTSTDRDWVTYTVQDAGSVTTSDSLDVVAQPAESSVDCTYDIVFGDYDDYGSYVDSTTNNPVSLDVLRDRNGDGVSISGGTGRLQLTRLSTDADDSPARRALDVNSPTIAATYSAPEQTWAPKVEFTVPANQSGVTTSPYDTVTIDAVFTRASGPATGCTASTEVTYTVQADASVHIAATHKVTHSYDGLETPANDIAGPSLIRFPADANEECTYTMTLPHKVGTGGSELTLLGMTPDPGSQTVSVPVQWSDAAEVLDAPAAGADPVVSTHRVRYLASANLDALATFTPTVTITVPQVTEAIPWSLDLNGDGDTADDAEGSGTTTNRFVGRRLAVTFTPTTASPDGCSEEVVSFLVVQYDGTVSGPMPTLSAKAPLNPSSGQGFDDAAHHYTPTGGTTPDGASRVAQGDCEYDVTFPMGDAVLSASAFPEFGGTCDPSLDGCYLAAPPGNPTPAVSGGCLLSPNPSQDAVDNNDCQSTFGVASAKPASASPTDTVVGSRLRRDSATAATATVTAAASTATANYTAPMLPLEPQITIDLPDEPPAGGTYNGVTFQVMFKHGGDGRHEIPSLRDNALTCSDDVMVTYMVQSDGSITPGTTPSLIGAPENYPVECTYLVVMPTIAGTAGTANALALDSATSTVEVGGADVENVAGSVQLRYPSKTFYYLHPDEAPRIPALTGYYDSDNEPIEQPAGTFVPDINFTIVPHTSRNHFRLAAFDVRISRDTSQGPSSGCSPNAALTYVVEANEFVNLRTITASGVEQARVFYYWERNGKALETSSDTSIVHEGVTYLIGNVPFLVDVPAGQTESCVYWVTFPNTESGDNDLRRIRPIETRAQISADEPSVGVTYGSQSYADSDFTFTPIVNITVPTAADPIPWRNDFNGNGDVLDTGEAEGATTNRFVGRQIAVTFTPTGSSPPGCSEEVVSFMAVQPSGDVVGPMPTLVDHPARNPASGDGVNDPAHHDSGLNAPGVAAANCQYRVTFPLGDGFVADSDLEALFPASENANRLAQRKNSLTCLFVPDPNGRDNNYCFDGDGNASAKPASASATTAVAGSRLRRDGAAAAATVIIHADSATATASYSADATMFEPDINFVFPEGTSGSDYAGRTFNVKFRYIEWDTDNLGHPPAGYPLAGQCTTSERSATYAVGADGTVTGTAPSLIGYPTDSRAACLYWAFLPDRDGSGATGLGLSSPHHSVQELYPDVTFTFHVLGDGPLPPPQSEPNVPTFQPVIRINIPTETSAMTTVDGVTTSNFVGKEFRVHIRPIASGGCTPEGTVIYQIQQDGSVRTHWTVRDGTFEVAPRLSGAPGCAYRLTFPASESYPAGVPGNRQVPGSRLQRSTSQAMDVSPLMVNASATYTAPERTFSPLAHVMLAVDSPGDHADLTFDVTYTHLDTGVVPSIAGLCTASETVTYTVNSSGTVSTDQPTLISYPENNPRGCLYEVTLPTTLADGQLELGIPQTQAVSPDHTGATFAYYVPGGQQYLATLPTPPAGMFAPQVSVTLEPSPQTDQYLGATFDVVFSRSGGPSTGCSADTTVTYEVAAFDTVYAKTVVGVDDEDANLVATTFIQVAGSPLTERTPWLIDRPNPAQPTERCVYSVTYPMTEQGGSNLSRLAVDHDPETSAADPATSARYGARRPAAPARRFAPEVTIALTGDETADAYEGLTFTATFSRADGPAGDCSTDGGVVIAVTYEVAAGGFVYGKTVTGTSDVRDVTYSIGGGATVISKAPWLVDTSTTPPHRECSYAVTYSNTEVLTNPASDIPKLLLRRHLDPDSLSDSDEAEERTHRVSAEAPSSSVTYGPLRVTYDPQGDVPRTFTPATVEPSLEAMFAPDINFSLPRGNNGRNYEFAGAQFSVTFSRTAGPATGCSPDVTVLYEAAATIASMASDTHGAFVYGKTVTGTDEVLEVVHLLHGSERRVINRTPWLVDVPDNQPGGATESCVYSVTFPDNEMNAANLLTRLASIDPDTEMAFGSQVSAAQPRATAIYRRTTPTAASGSFTPDVTITVPQVSDPDLRSGAPLNRFHGLTFEVMFAKADSARTNCSDDVTKYFAIDEDGTIDGSAPTLVDIPVGETAPCDYTVTFSARSLLCAKPGAAVGTELERYEPGDAQYDASEGGDQCDHSRYNGNVEGRLTRSATGLVTTTSAANPAATATYEALEETFTPTINIALPQPATDFSGRVFTISFAETSLTYDLAPARECTASPTDAVYTVGTDGTITATTAPPALIGYAADHAGECAYDLTVSVDDEAGLTLIPENLVPSVQPRYPERTLSYVDSLAHMFLPDVSLLVVPLATPEGGTSDDIADAFMGTTFRVTFSRSGGPATGCSPDITVTYRVSRGIFDKVLNDEEDMNGVDVSGDNIPISSSYFVYGDTIEGDTPVQAVDYNWDYEGVPWGPPGSNAVVPDPAAAGERRNILRSLTPYLIDTPDPAQPTERCIYSVDYPLNETVESGVMPRLVRKPRSVHDGVGQTTFGATQTRTLNAGTEDEIVFTSINLLDTETSAADPLTGAVYAVPPPDTPPGLFRPTVNIEVPQVTVADANPLVSDSTPQGMANAFAARTFEVTFARTATSPASCKVYVDWAPQRPAAAGQDQQAPTLEWSQDQPFVYVIQNDGTVVHQTPLSAVVPTPPEMPGGEPGTETVTAITGGRNPLLSTDDACDYNVTFAATSGDGTNGQLQRTTTATVMIDADAPTAEATYTAPETTFEPTIAINLSPDDTAYAGVTFAVRFERNNRAIGRSVHCTSSHTVMYSVQSDGTVTPASTPTLVRYPANNPLPCLYTVEFPDTAGTGATALVIDGPTRYAIESQRDAHFGTDFATVTYRPANTFTPSVDFKLLGPGAVDAHEGKQFTVTFARSDGPMTGCSTGVTATYTVMVDGNYNFVVGTQVNGTDDVSETTITIGGIEVRGRTETRSGQEGTVVETNSARPENWIEADFITPDTASLTINGVMYGRDSANLLDGTALSVLERALLAGETLLVGGGNFVEQEPRLIDVPHGEVDACVYSVTFAPYEDGGNETLSIAQIDDRLVTPLDVPADFSGEVSAVDPDVTASVTASYRPTSSFRPQVTLTVPQATTPVSWRHDYNDDGDTDDPGETGDATNHFVGKRIAVTFEPASGSPNGCSQKLISFLVVQYNGTVAGPMPVLIGTPVGGTQSCTYDVTFALGDTPLDVSTSEPTDGSDPASASGTAAVAGSRLRRSTAASATVSVASKEATATYTAPATTFDAAGAITVEVPGSVYDGVTFDVAVAEMSGSLFASGCSASTTITFTVQSDGSVTAPATMLNSYGEDNSQECIYELRFPANIGTGATALVPVGSYIQRAGWVPGENAGDPPVWTVWNYLAGNASAPRVRSLQQSLPFDAFTYIASIPQSDLALVAGPRICSTRPPAVPPSEELPCRTQPLDPEDHSDLDADTFFVPFVNIVAPPETTLNAAGERVSIYSGLSFEVTFRPATGSPASGCSTALTATYFITDNGTTLTDGGTPRGGQFVAVTDAAGMQLTETVNDVEHPQWRIIAPRLVDKPDRGEADRCIYDVVFPPTDTNPMRSGFADAEHTAHGSLTLTAGTPRTDDNTKIVGRQVQKSTGTQQWNDFGGNPEMATATYAPSGLSIRIELANRWLIRGLLNEDGTPKLDENGQRVTRLEMWEDAGPATDYAGQTFDVTVSQSTEVPTHDECSADQSVTLMVAPDGTIASGQVDLVRYAQSAAHLCRYAVAVPESVSTTDTQLEVVNQRHSLGWLERSWPDPALRSVTGFTTDVTFFYAPVPPAGPTLSGARASFIPALTFAVPDVDVNRNGINDLRQSEIVVKFTLAANQGFGCATGLVEDPPGTFAATARYVVGMSGWTISGHGTAEEPWEFSWEFLNGAPDYTFTEGDVGNQVTLQSLVSGFALTDGQNLISTVGGPHLSRLVGGLPSAADDGTPCTYDVNVVTTSLAGQLGNTYDLTSTAAVTVTAASPTASYTYAGVTTIPVHVDITVPAYDLFGGDTFARDADGNILVNTVDERSDDGRGIGDQVRQTSFFVGGTIPVRFARSAGPADGCSDVTVDYVIHNYGRVLPPGTPPTPPRLIDVPPNQPGGATEQCVYTATFPDTVSSSSSSSSAAIGGDTWSLTGTGTGTVTVALIDTDQAVTWNQWEFDAATSTWVCATTPRTGCTGTPGELTVETDTDTNPDDIWAVQRTYTMGATSFTPRVSAYVPQAFGTDGSLFAGTAIDVTFNQSAGPATDCSSAMTATYTVDATGRATGTPPVLIDRPLGATSSCEYAVSATATFASASGVMPSWTLNLATDPADRVSANSRVASTASRSATVHYLVTYVDTFFVPQLDIVVPRYSAVTSDGNGASFFEGGVIQVTFTPATGAPTGCPTVTSDYVVLVDGEVRPMFGQGLADGEFTTPSLIDVLDGESTPCTYTVGFPQTVTTDTRTPATFDARAHWSICAAGREHWVTEWELSCLDRPDPNNPPPPREPNPTEVEAERTWTLTSETAPAPVLGASARVARRTYAMTATSFQPVVRIGVPPFDDEDGNNVFAGHTFNVTFARSGGPMTGCSADTSAVYTVQNDGTVTGDTPMLVDRPATSIDDPGCEYEVGYPATATAPAADPFDWTLNVHRPAAPVVQVEVTRAERATALDAGTGPIGIQAVRYYDWDPISFDVDLQLSVPPHVGTGANAGRNAYAGATITAVFEPLDEPARGCSTSTTTVYEIGDDGSAGPQGGTLPSLVDRPAGRAVLNEALPAPCYYQTTLTTSDTTLAVPDSFNTLMASFRRTGATRFVTGETTFTPSATVSVPFIDENSDSDNDLADETVTVTYTPVASAHEDCMAATETYTVDAAESSTPDTGTATLTSPAASLVNHPAGEDDPCEYTVELTQSTALDTAAPAKSAVPATIRAGTSTVITYLTATSFNPMVTVVVPFIDDGAGANSLANETVTVTYTPVAGSHSQCMSATEIYTVSGGGSASAGGMVTVDAAASLVHEPPQQATGCRYTVAATPSAGLSDAVGARIAQTLSATEIAEGVSITITYTAPTRFTPMVTVTMPFIDDGAGANTLTGETVMVTFTPVAGSHAHCEGGTATYTVDAGGTVAAGTSTTLTTVASLIDVPVGETTGCRYTISLSQSQTISQQAAPRPISPQEVGAGDTVAVTYSAASGFTPMVTVKVPFVDENGDANNDLATETVMVMYTPVADSHQDCVAGSETYTIGTSGTAEDGGEAMVTAATMLIDVPAGQDTGCQYQVSVTPSQALREQAPRHVISPAQIGAGVAATVDFTIRQTRLPPPPPKVHRTIVISTIRGPAIGGSGTPSGVGSDIGDDEPGDGDNPFAGFIPAPLNRVPVSVSVTLPETMLGLADTVEILISSPGVCGSDLAAFGGVPAGIGLAYGVNAQSAATIDVVSAGTYELPAFAERGRVRRPCALRVTVLAAPTDCVLTGAQTDGAGRGYVELEWSEDSESLDLVPAFVCGEEAAAAGDPAGDGTGDGAGDPAGDGTGDDTGEPATPAPSQSASASVPPAARRN